MTSMSRGGRWWLLSSWWTVMTRRAGAWKFVITNQVAMPAASFSCQVPLSLAKIPPLMTTATPTTHNILDDDDDDDDDQYHFIVEGQYYQFVSASLTMSTLNDES